MINKQILESELVKPFLTRSQSDVRGEDDSKAIGQGAFAWAEPKDDDHEVDVKSYNFEKPTEDAKQLYYNAIEDLVGGNPYVPVVYNRHETTNSKKRIKNDYTMEKLLPYNSVDPRRLLIAVNQTLEDCGSIVSPEAKDKFASLLNSNDSNLTTRIIDQTMYVFTKLLGNALKRPELTQGHLSEVAARIKDIVNEYDLFIDMKPDNVMFRRTKYGLQLVITDPVA